MTTFQIKLIKLQNEQKALLNYVDKRKKAVRQRIEEITKEFYATKEAWRNFDKTNIN